MRSICLLLICLLSSCALFRHHELSPNPSGLACPRKDYRASEVDKPQSLRLSDTGEYEGWVLFQGCGQELLCESVDAELGTCRESPAFATVRDRLNLETGCAPTQIHIDAAADWSRGGELAYRLNACGSSYICTTAIRSSTNCKAALANQAQPLPTAPPPPAP